MTILTLFPFILSDQLAMSSLVRNLAIVNTPFLAPNSSFFWRLSRVDFKKENF